jgi:hypothetical protein
MKYLNMPQVLCTFPVLFELGSLVSPSILSWFYRLQPGIVFMTIGARPYLCGWVCLLIITPAGGFHRAWFI